MTNEMLFLSLAVTMLFCTVAVGFILSNQIDKRTDEIKFMIIDLDEEIKVYRERLARTEPPVVVLAGAPAASEPMNQSASESMFTPVSGWWREQ